MAATALHDAYLRILSERPYMKSVLTPGRRLVDAQSYAYNPIVGSAARPLSVANGAVTQTQETHADSDFVCTYISSSLMITANGDMKVNRNVTLQVQDTQTGKPWFNIPIVVTLVTGGGGFPFQYVAPRVVRANSTLLLTAQNRDTTQDYLQLYVTFGGIRLFYE